MLLFEAPALAVSPPQLYAGAQPEGPGALPVGAPSAGGDGACKAIESPRMSEYLNGEACPPVGFPYEPQMVKVGEQIRMTDPNGSCTSGPISPKGLSFDFRTACLTHDYGYDLLRHLKMTGGRRRAVDLFFLEDLTGLCAAGPDDHEIQCLRAAKLAYRAVRTLSDLHRLKTPWGTAEA
jgi:hypothetical protein